MKLKELISQHLRGVYLADQSLSSESLKKSIGKANWFFAYLDGSCICNTQSLFKVTAQALKFPAQFGQNWDAFADYLTDLHWIESANMLVWYRDYTRFAIQEPDQFAIALHQLVYATRSVQHGGYIILMSGDEKNLPKKIQRCKGYHKTPV